MPEQHQFQAGQAYANVYFLKVDAKGHSQIVRQNDADKADYAFDQFEALVYESVDEAAKRCGCAYAKFWGWQGDGGLCILYDNDESKARTATLEAAEIILAD